MGIFSRLFGKKQPPVPEAPPAVKDMADASVKDVVCHVFNELARGAPRDQIRSELIARVLSHKETGRGSAPSAACYISAARKAVPSPDDADP